MLPNNPQAGLPQPSCFLTSLIKKSPDTPECGHSRKCVLKIERLPGVGCLAVPPPSGGQGRTARKLGAPRKLRGARGTLSRRSSTRPDTLPPNGPAGAALGATPAQPGLVIVLDPRFCAIRPSLPQRHILPAVLPPTTTTEGVCRPPVFVICSL